MPPFAMISDYEPVLRDVADLPALEREGWFDHGFELTGPGCYAFPGDGHVDARAWDLSVPSAVEEMRRHLGASFTVDELDGVVAGAPVARAVMAGRGN